MIIKPKFKTEETKIYFMGDLHYGHSNVIRFDDRPFEDIEEMNQYILDELKRVLKPDDVLFDLGDMFWKTQDVIMKDVLNQIPTKNIYKILGNHDKPNLYKNFFSDYFKEIGDLFDITIEHEYLDYKVVLSHYPLMSWQSKAYGSIHLHAHCHGNMDEVNKSSSDLRVDIGFNSELAKQYGSFIIPFEKIIEYFDNKTGGLDYYNWAKQAYEIL